jgi:hypothetical protein
MMVNPAAISFRFFEIAAARLILLLSVLYKFIGKLGLLPCDFDWRGKRNENILHSFDRVGLQKCFHF